MQKLDEREFKTFELFNREWALVTAGSIEDFNTCTVGWGMMGSIWGKPGKGRPAITVYVHPARYTSHRKSKSIITRTERIIQMCLQMEPTMRGRHTMRSSARLQI